MSEELKPVRCGCGGEPVVGHIEKTSYLPKDRWYIGCPKCDICTGLYDTETEAVEAWNKAICNNITYPYPCATENGDHIRSYITNTNTSPNEDLHPVLDCMIGKERTAKVMGEDGNYWHVCTDCDRSVEESWKYCPMCGRRLEWE